MKLLINGWRTHGRTGVPRYLNNIVRHFSRDRVPDVFDDLRFLIPRPLEPDGVTLPPGVAAEVVGPDMRAFLWENLRLSPRAAGGVLWGPSYTLPLHCRTPTVVTIHDAANALLPEATTLADRTFYRWLYGHSARRATRVIVTSPTLRDEVAGAYGVRHDRMRIVPLAPADVFRRLEGGFDAAAVRHAHFGADRPFFLCVGTMSRRRNTPLVIRAFGEFKRRGRTDHVLALVGRKPPDLDLDAQARAAGVEGSVRHLQQVFDGKLNELYNAATALVLAPTYDAASIPVYEALRIGLPVIAPRSPAMLDITGGHALHVEVVDERNLAAAMQCLVGDAAQWQRLAAAGYERGRIFSWEATAVQTLAVLAEAARAGAPRG